MAIEIASPARELLAAARARYEPSAGEMPPHITILPPIDVDGEAMPAVEAHLRDVAGATRPFRITLCGTGTFRPATPVVFVAIADGLAECEQLERRVRSGDMAVETRYAYHPHVTLAHDVPDAVLERAVADLSTFMASMVVGSMGLYEHVDGVWNLVREFAFTGD